MMRADWLGHGLLWKDCRERAPRVGLLAATLTVASMGLVALAARAAAQVEGSAIPAETLSVWIGILYLLGVVEIGTGLLDRPERDAARGTLWTLPIPRRRVLAIKLGAIGMQWAALTAAFGAVFALAAPGLDSPSRAIFLTFVAWSPPLLGLALNFSLFYRSALVAAVLACVAGPSLLVALSADLAFAPPFLEAYRYSDPASFWARAPGWHVTGWSIACAAALAGTLFWLFCRAWLEDRTDNLRGAMGLLFGIVFVTLAGVLSLTGWRDLIYLVLGR